MLAFPNSKQRHNNTIDLVLDKEKHDDAQGTRNVEGDKCGTLSKQFLTDKFKPKLGNVNDNSELNYNTYPSIVSNIQHDET